jgi:predicted RNA-binding Zn-ribbon protein involved in translation (DUF1610 family)
MPDDPRDDKAEVEVICPNCGYHLTRSVARLRRDTPLVCPNCGKEIVEPDHGGNDRRRKPGT